MTTVYHVGRDALIPPLELVQTLRRLEGKPPYARYLQIQVCQDNYSIPDIKLQSAKVNPFARRAT